MHLDKTACAIIGGVHSVEVVHLAYRSYAYFFVNRLRSRDSRLQLFNQRGDIVFLVLTEHIVHPFYLSNLLGLELGIAARNDDDGVGVFAVELVDGLSVLVVGGVCDGAGIHHAHIGHFAQRSALVSAQQQLFAEGTALGKVEFAS